MAITTTTVAKFRATTSAPTADAYLVLDAGVQPSLWHAAPAGSADLDNGATFLRNKKGFGLARVYDGVRHASMFGIKPGMDVRDKLQRYVSDLSKEEYGTAFIFQHGLVEASAIDLGHTALKLACLNGKATFRGEKIFRWGDGYGNILQLSGLGFLGPGKRDYGPDLHEDDRLLLDNALLYGNGVVSIDDRCTFAESAGDLVALEGWELPGKPLTNVSGSYVGKSLFQRASGFGLRIVGNNANGCNVLCNDFRDNGGGFKDDSQVGGRHEGNLYHLNSLFGDFVAEQPGNTGKSEGNYYEERHSGAPNRYDGQLRVRDAHRNGTPKRGQNVDFKDAQDPWVLRQEGRYGRGLYLKDGSPTPAFQYGSGEASLRRNGVGELRTFAGPWLSTPTLAVGRNLLGMEVPSLEEAQKMAYTLRPSDVLYPLDGTPPVRVASGGTGGRVLEGVTASGQPGADGKLVLSGRIDQLAPGMETLGYMQTVAVAGLIVAVSGIDKNTKQPFVHQVRIDALYNDPNSGIRAIGPYEIKEQFDNLPLRIPAPVFAPLPTE